MTPEQKQHLNNLVKKYPTAGELTYNGVPLNEHTKEELMAIMKDTNERLIRRRQDRTIY